MPPFHLGVQPTSAGQEPAEAASPEFWVRTAQLADAADLDLLVLDDSFAPGEGPRPDAVAVACRVAPVTSRTGLVPVVTTTHTEPFHTNKAIATLDLVSAGRAGWQVGVSATEAEALAFGRRPLAPAERLWAEAVDTVEVVRKLWDSWEDDAVVRDVTTGRYVDRDRVHHVDHAGPEFSVRGPSITPRSPQGQPLVVARVREESSLPVAAVADLVRVAADDPALAGRVRTVAAAAGRTPVLLGDVVLAPTTPATEVLRLLERRDGLDGAVLVLSAGTAAEIHAFLARLGAEVVPGLRTAGRRPSVGGPAGSLRDRFGLPRPVSRYARPVDMAPKEPR